MDITTYVQWWEPASHNFFIFSVLWCFALLASHYRHNALLQMTLGVHESQIPNIKHKIASLYPDWACTGGRHSVLGGPNDRNCCLSTGTPMVRVRCVTLHIQNSAYTDGPNVKSTDAPRWSAVPRMSDTDSLKVSGVRYRLVKLYTQNVKDTYVPQMSMIQMYPKGQDLDVPYVNNRYTTQVKDIPQRHGSIPKVNKATQSLALSPAPC